MKYKLSLQNSTVLKMQHCNWMHASSVCVEGKEKKWFNFKMCISCTLLRHTISVRLR